MAVSLIMRDDSLIMGEPTEPKAASGISNTSTFRSSLWNSKEQGRPAVHNRCHHLLAGLIAGLLTAL
jgi:hypothetical protein